jgi:predicted CoA-substrate-specific enzyme activase
MEERFLVGIDVGSTTIKGVVVESATLRVLWKDYQRHGTHQAGKTLECLKRMAVEVGISTENCRLFFTGSGAAGPADLVGGRFVQEVHAVALAVESRFPRVRSVVELGGQDAKIVVLKENPAAGTLRKIPSMNDKCAGGTGAVIDRVAARLGLSPVEVRNLPYRGVELHPVAGKCGVFAETDVNNLRVRGICAREIMASLFEAVVLQNLTVLTRGHTLYPEVLLLGGPHAFFPGLVEAWRENISKMWSERGVRLPTGKTAEDLVLAPPDSQYFGALGAAQLGCAEDRTGGRYVGTDRLERSLEESRLGRKAGMGVAGLVASRAEAAAFTRAFQTQAFRAAAPRPHGTVRGFLGVDGGSTTTKAVLLAKSGKVLHKAYRLSAGNPIEELVAVLGEIRERAAEAGGNVEVLGVGTTGYAKDLFKDLIGADVALVETIAHARSALHLYRDPHVIVDVGGQDIKLILLRDGHVKDFMLNSQCSAGNGYYLQATARSFGLNVDEYAEAAFSADRMPMFGHGCAVFLQSDIVNFQRQGWSAEEILAGLAAVLPRNIWLYVARIPDLAGLGTRFVLQGGTQKNLAAVKAQVDYIRQQFQSSDREPEITVHRHCGEAGAIGAALEAIQLWKSGRRTTFIGLDRVGAIQFSATRNEDTRCRYCTNRCLRTFVDVSLPPSATGDGVRTENRRLILAGCEKGTAETVEAMRAVKARLDAVKAANPNLAEIAGREVWKSPGPRKIADTPPAWGWRPRARRRSSLVRRRPRLRVGIPRVLNFYQYAPLFTGYLESLGVDSANIVFSDRTSEALYREGARRSSIDPCYPAKVAPAHVHNLINNGHRRRRLDCIFFPMLAGLTSPLVDTVDETACCTVSATPESVKAAFTREKDVFAEEGIVYVEPLLDLRDRRLFAHQMMEAWNPVLGLSPRENERAVEEGFAALERFQSAMRRRAREVIDQLERENRIGLLVLGRPYHHDSGLNHEILEGLRGLGYPVLTQCTLPLDQDLLDRLFGEEVRTGAVSHPLTIGDVWLNAFSTNSSMKIWAAKFAARHPNLVALEISNFNCGHDAAIYAVCEAIVEASGTPFFSFRDLDENKPSGTFKIRIETIDYFLRQYRKRLEQRQRRRRELDGRMRRYEVALRRKAQTRNSPGVLEPTPGSTISGSADANPIARERDDLRI